MTNLNNKKKILISGGEGKFANQLIMANEEYDILSPGRTEMNITSIKSIDDFISNTSPDIFLHSAAFTRPKEIIKKTRRYPLIMAKMME